MLALHSIRRRNISSTPSALIIQTAALRGSSRMQWPPKNNCLVVSLFSDRIRYPK